MFFLIYFIYRLLCVILVIKFTDDKDTMFKAKKVNQLLVNLIPILFYFFMYTKGLYLFLFILLSIGAVISTLIKSKNKVVEVLSILNIIEWCTIFIPSVYMYIDNTTLFTPSDYEIYFLIWKIFPNN